jgi:pSer/pThr/pTyr-binding forkhead associated (FHA) protein
MADIRYFIKKLPNGEERELTGIVPVGREVEGGLKLVEDGASRKHANLIATDGILSVEDLGSRNGSYVNDVAVTGKTPLKSGDRVRFDKEEFQVRIQSSEPTVFGARAADKKPVAGAWVDWNTAGGDGTERFTPEQLSEYLQKSKERRAKLTTSDFKEPCLTVTSGAKEGAVIPLGGGDAGGGEWTIGRGAECAIRFDEGDISEWHAKIVREGQKWKLIDAISSNGSFVNDLRIGMSYLASGDCLRFGRTECVFHLPGAGAATGARNRTAAAGDGAGAGKKKLIIAIAVSFVVTLIVLYLLFRSSGH